MKTKHVIIMSISILIYISFFIINRLIIYNKHILINKSFLAVLDLAMIGSIIIIDYIIVSSFDMKVVAAAIFGMIALALYSVYYVIADPTNELANFNFVHLEFSCVISAPLAFGMAGWKRRSLIYQGAIASSLLIYIIFLLSLMASLKLPQKTLNHIYNQLIFSVVMFLPILLIYLIILIIKLVKFYSIIPEESA